MKVDTDIDIKQSRWSVLYWRLRLSASNAIIRFQNCGFTSGVRCYGSVRILNLACGSPLWSVVDHHWHDPTGLSSKMGLRSVCYVFSQSSHRNKVRCRWYQTTFLFRRQTLSHGRFWGAFLPGGLLISNKFYEFKFWLVLHWMFCWIQDLWTSEAARFCDLYVPRWLPSSPSCELKESCVKSVFC